jgi:putative hydrolase of the HAD superfamily
VLRGVLFDLFGTLVPPFRRVEHTEVIEACARRLDVAFERLHQGWIDSFPDRIRGRYPSIAANFRDIAASTGALVDDRAIDAACEAYAEFTRSSLVPSEETLDALERLTRQGLSLALVTNCAPDVPAAWSRSPLARYFRYCAFSCEVGVAKPASEIYLKAAAGLNLAPEDLLFVGDGSDDELGGAERCGMRAALLDVDLSNTYDSHRPGVLGWTGLRVGSISAVRNLALVQ